MATPTLFTALQTEWAALERTPASAASLRRWRHEEPALAELADLPSLVAAVERRDQAAAGDAILSALARRAPTDDFAARTLLQLLLPGVKALARRLWWLGDPDERAAAVVAAVYERIRTYPWQRRPARIAANILADAGQRLLRRNAAARRPVEVFLDDIDQDLACEPAGPSPTEELLALLGWAVTAGHLTHAQVQLIGLTRIADTPFEQLGEPEGVSAPSMRRRRQRAERQLAAAVNGAAATSQGFCRLSEPACA